MNRRSLVCICVNALLLASSTAQAGAPRREVEVDYLHNIAKPDPTFDLPQAVARTLAIDPALKVVPHLTARDPIYDDVVIETVQVPSRLDTSAVTFLALSWTQDPAQGKAGAIWIVEPETFFCRDDQVQACALRIVTTFQKFIGEGP